MHERFMRMALDQAALGTGRTSPNPLVGAVIVDKDENVIATGWHRKAGTPHAEIHALREAGDKAKGTTLYVNLEPCCHYGRTGPCTEAIIAAGVEKVVVAMTDPNKEVAGKGIARLQQAGIHVIQGILADEAARLNEVFIKWIATRMPFTSIKTAMSLDGKIAAYTGHSKWITGEEARIMVHSMRDRYDAILVGIGTVLADDPELTVRLIEKGRNPVRIIVDTHARIPLSAKLLNDKAAPTLVVVSEEASAEKCAAISELGAEVSKISLKNGLINMRELFQLLGEKAVTSILVEGGAKINAALLADNLVDKIYSFIAPKVIGGTAAPGPVAGQGVANVNEAVALEETGVQMVGQDILVTNYVLEREGRNVYRSCRGIG